jgi:hypothetical protein
VVGFDFAAPRSALASLVVKHRGKRAGMRTQRSTLKKGLMSSKPWRKSRAKSTLRHAKRRFTEAGASLLISDSVPSSYCIVPASSEAKSVATIPIRSGIARAYCEFGMAQKLVRRLSEEPFADIRKGNTAAGDIFYPSVLYSMRYNPLDRYSFVKTAEVSYCIL